MVYVLHKHPEPWIYHDISHYIHGDISMKYCTLKLLAAVPPRVTRAPLKWHAPSPASVKQ